MTICCFPFLMQIFMQKGKQMDLSFYDDIKSVVSIWICMNMSENSLTHYHMTHDNKNSKGY